MRLLSTASILAALALPATAQASPALSLPIEQHVLGNGLRLVFAPDPSLDDVTVLVRYDVGSADDPDGKDGLAHLVEHLMFDGSEHVPRGEHFRWIERVGGWGFNAQTGMDDTSYFATVPPGALATLFWLESDRMGFLAGQIEPRRLEHERQLVADELNEKVLDRGLGSVPAVAMREVFPPWHPYHRGHETGSLANVTVRDVRAFLRTWYAPRNATVFVAGRFDPAAALALADKYFGDLPTPASPARPALPATWKTPDVRVDMAAGVTRDTVVIAWPAPAYGQPADAALDLAASALTDPLGRLQRELLHGGLVVQVGAHESSFRRGSTFTVTATVADGKSPEDVVAAVEDAMRRLGESVSAEECARARAEWADVILLRLQTSAGRAHWLAGAPASRASWDLAKYDALTPADVARAVHETLASGNRTVVVVHHDARYPARGVVLRRTEGGS